MFKPSSFSVLAFHHQRLAHQSFIRPARLSLEWQPPKLSPLSSVSPSDWESSSDSQLLHWSCSGPALCPASAAWYPVAALCSPVLRRWLPVKELWMIKSHRQHLDHRAKLVAAVSDWLAKIYLHLPNPEMCLWLSWFYKPAMFISLVEVAKEVLLRLMLVAS